jgi:hypothetical protein
MSGRSTAISAHGLSSQAMGFADVQAESIGCPEKPQHEAVPVILKMLERVCNAIKDACISELGRSVNTVFMTDPGRMLNSIVDSYSSYQVDGHDSLKTNRAEGSSNNETSQYRENDVVWFTVFKAAMTNSNAEDVRSNFYCHLYFPI